MMVGNRGMIMHERQKIVFAGIIFLFFSLVISSARMPARDRDRGFSSNPIAATAPMVIASNADFDTYDSGGDGTPGNPWIIESFTIDCAGSGFGILVNNTTDHAIIRNGFIKSSGVGAADLVILNAANVDIDNVTLQDNYNRACFVLKSSDITFTNVTSDSPNFAANGDNYFVDGCTRVNWTDCTITNTTQPHRTGWRLDKVYAGPNSYLMFDNCTINDHNGDVIFTGTDATSHVIVQNCRYNHSEGMHFIGGHDLVFVNNTGSILVDSMLTINDYDDVIIANNTNVYYITSYGFSIQDGDNYSISGNTFVDSNALTLNNVTNVIVSNNTFSGTAAVSTASLTENVTATGNHFTGNTNSFVSTDTNNINISGNTFDNVNKAMHVATSTNITFANNDVENIAVEAIYIGGSDINVTGNRFTNVTAYLNDAGGSVIKWDSNYYFEYFNTNPFDVTTDLAMTTLPSSWAINTTLNDTHPRYFAPWYPRNTMIYFAYYSNVDGLGINPTNLHVLLNSIPLTVTYPVIQNVLFRLTVSDYHGRLLYDEVLNLNDTGIYINVGLDLAVQVFFNFYSTIDHFGLDFSIVKLYIDGTRITRFDPIIQLTMINVTVTDYSDSLVYNNMLNLTVTGVYLDIGLDIAPINVINNFDRTVTFSIERNNISTAMTLPPGMSVTLRFALGAYNYTAIDMNGVTLVNESITFASSAAISLGTKPTQVFIRYYSSVTGDEIAFGLVNTSVNGTLITADAPLIGGSAFNLTVTCAGLVYHGAIHAVNASNPYVQVSLDLVPDVHVSYFSSLDPFGYEFSLSILYVNGTRLSTQDLPVFSKHINVTVKDRTNRVLNTTTLVMTSRFVDILLPITTVLVNNNFATNSTGAIFHYASNGIEIASFPIGGGKSIPIRVALGAYRWWVTGEDGDALEDVAGDDIGDVKSVTGPGSIDFGWIVVKNSTAPVDPNSMLIVYISISVIVGMAIGIPLAMAVRARYQVPRRRTTYRVDRE